jgi:protein required for attachment to host cells
LAAKQRSLIIVADRETAHFYRHTGPGAALESVHEIVRPSEGDTHADRPGRAFDSQGQGRHAMEHSSSYEENERRAMAAELAKYAGGSLDAGEVDRLVLLVEPRLLGELRNELPESARTRVVIDEPIHLTQADTREIAERLSKDGRIGRVQG